MYRVQLVNLWNTQSYSSPGPAHDIIINPICILLSPNGTPEGGLTVWRLSIIVCFYVCWCDLLIIVFYPNCCKNNHYQKNHFLGFILQCTLTNFIHWSRLAQLSRWYALDMRSLSLENWEKVTIIQTTTQQTRFQGRAVLALFGGLLVHFRYWSGDIQHS